MQLVTGAGVPIMAERRAYFDAGALMHCTANISDQYRRAAGDIDKILCGASSGELPIEQPAKYVFAINLRTGRALSITIPPKLLIQATELIE